MQIKIKIDVWIIIIIIIIILEIMWTVLEFHIFYHLKRNV